MESSSGSSTQVVEDCRTSLRMFSYFMWFLMGFCGVFSLKIIIFSAKQFKEIFRVSAEESELFLSRVAGLAILWFLVGFFLCHLFGPMNIFLSEFLAFTLMVMFTVMGVVLIKVENKTVFTFVYFVWVVVTSAGVGAIDMIAITASNHPNLIGISCARMFGFIIGQAIGYTMALQVDFCFELGWFGKFADGFREVAAIYCLLGTIAMAILAVPFVFYLIRCSQDKNFTSSEPTFMSIVEWFYYYDEGFHMLTHYLSFALGLIFIHSMDGFFTQVSLHSFRNFDDRYKTDVGYKKLLLALSTYDLLGRVYSVAITNQIQYDNDWYAVVEELTNGNVEKFEKEKYFIKDNGSYVLIEEIPDLVVKRRGEKYKLAMMVCWGPILFTFVTSMCILLKRHLPDNDILGLLINESTIRLIILANLLIKGYVICFVYINLYELMYFHLLHEAKLTMYPMPQESVSSLLPRYKSAVISAISTSTLSMISIYTYVLWRYLGYRYNTLFLEAEFIKNQTNNWPTDQLEDWISKLLWWLNNFGLSIIRDLTNPFGLIKYHKD